MRIAVWNIDRLRRKSRLNDIISACEDIKADILVLTEADERVTLQGYDNICRTERPEDHKLPQYAAPIHYAETERRVIIYSKYQIAQQHHTYNARTACCVELKTCSGDLWVYGMIIGIHGWQNPYFEDELEGTLKDIKKLTAEGKKVCCIGDYNCSFADDYFCKKTARDAIVKCFTECGMNLLTQNQPQCIDHIAISEEFVNENLSVPEEWNLDRKLSDHKGILVTL